MVGSVAVLVLNFGRHGKMAHSRFCMIGEVSQNAEMIVFHQESRL